MGKIFGICDNPVSTIESAIGLRPIKIRDCSLVTPVRIYNKDNSLDKFVKTDKVVKSNPFIKMRNGFGKLMASFSHKKDV